MSQEVVLPGIPNGISLEALRRQGESQFRRLLEKLPAGAYTCDREGLITYFNQRAAEIWGRRPKLNDPADRYCGSFHLFTTEGAPIQHDQCWMALALREDREYNGREIVIERPDGSRVTVLAHANPIRDERGQTFAAVNVLVDITDRKRVEDSLREAERSKDEFLATLAHELRNPLAPIRNAVQILEADAEQSRDARWALDVIDRQMTHMTRLIDDLMDVSRISRNELELRRERIELGEVIRLAVETSRPLLDAGGHELIVTEPSRPIPLQGDVTRLAQALSNLLNNAAKYSDRSGTIHLTVEPHDDAVAVLVRDAGIGIPASMLSRVFDLFVQVDRSLSKARGGLGIGLTLVKRVVESHGGRVEARSAGPGQGSEFAIHLPVARELEPAATARESARRRQVPTSSLRVLVVDDNPDAADSLAAVVRLGGNETRVAYDGAQALAAASELRPDVVLLDIGLPSLNGYEVAQRLRGEPWGARAVLVAVTGWGQETDRQRSREAGFDHHLVKPVDPMVVMDLLAKLDARTTPAERSDRSG